MENRMDSKPIKHSSKKSHKKSHKKSKKKSKKSKKSASPVSKSHSPVSKNDKCSFNRYTRYEDIDLNNVDITKIDDSNHVVVDLRFITITQPIRNAVLSIKPSFNFSGMRRDFFSDGCPLERMYKKGYMKGVMDLTPYEFAILLLIDPVKLKRGDDGFYVIQDGRHRVARSIIDGKTFVNAIIEE